MWVGALGGREAGGPLGVRLPAAVPRAVGWHWVSICSTWKSGCEALDPICPRVRCARLHEACCIRSHGLPLSQSCGWGETPFSGPLCLARSREQGDSLLSLLWAEEGRIRCLPKGHGHCPPASCPVPLICPARLPCRGKKQAVRVSIILL